MFRFASVVGVASVAGQSDGNPHNWGRVRRCDHVDYSPACGPCEGVGGLATSDKVGDFTPVPCQEVAVHSQSSRVRPVWGKDFTMKKSHEILIGIKTDPFCFRSFPGPDSKGDHCYKKQECQLYSEFNDYKAFILKCNQAGNAWNLAGNVTSTIYHQNTNMWIVNELVGGAADQCICTTPRSGGIQTNPGVGPIQADWVDNLKYVATETLHVEYGLGSMTLDHWAFGPHHAWVAPTTGLIVRMWQPFNGLQVFGQGPNDWSVGHAFEDAVNGRGRHKQHLFEQLAVSGTKAPDWCTKAGKPLNLVRIKCTEDGFSDPDGAEDSLTDRMVAPLGSDKAAASDLRRARVKVPRDEYKGDDFSSMARTLNKVLLKHAPLSRDCDSFTVKELQELQVQLLTLRDAQLNDVYHDTDDNRKITKDIPAIAQEWEELSQLASTDLDLTRALRDGHCHEAVMWYVHHLPEDMKKLLKDRIALPLLPFTRHDLKESAEHGVRVNAAYQDKVSCASCHTAQSLAVEISV